MKVNLRESNPALESIFQDPNQIISLDASFLIPPDRESITNQRISFSTFRDIWLDPVFGSFPKLAVHEAVLAELSSPAVQSFAYAMLDASPPRLHIHRDSDLTEVEQMLRNTIENRIRPFTRYCPERGLLSDRGEVKSLSYIAAKGLLYFAVHDSLAIQLIENAEDWSTGLDNIRAIKMYEPIFYLYAEGRSERKGLRMLYKHQYHLTNREKQENPEWSKFIAAMEALYGTRA